MSIENDVAWAWQQASEDLFMKFDDLKARHGSTDEEVIEAVNKWVGFDIADEYEQWISEGADE